MPNYITNKRYDHASEYIDIDTANPLHFSAYARSYLRALLCVRVQ